MHHLRPVGTWWPLWLTPPSFSFFSASWIFTGCLCDSGPGQQETQGDACALFWSYLFILNSFSNTMPRKFQPLLFSERQPLSLQLRKSQCSAWIPFRAESTSGRKARVTVGPSCLIFFSEISVAQGLKTVSLYILFRFLVLNSERISLAPATPSWLEIELPTILLTPISVNTILSTQLKFFE